MTPLRRLLSLPLLVAAVASCPRHAHAQQPDSTALPRVLIITTGGTIAGVQDAPGTLGSYRAGALGAKELIAAVPVLPRYAQVESEAFSAVASTMITPAMWVGLSKRINEVLRTRPEIAGVVVTHGTDRLEETAFFLYLTVKSDKPVVVVGAQRPATGISPDGPINLLSAVRTAAAAQSVGKGVLVVMDDRILSARESRKYYPRNGGFDGGEMGMLGVVAGSGPSYFFAPVRRHGAATEFDPAPITTLPDVDLVFAYPGGTGREYARAPAGVVLSATGMTCAESASYQKLARGGTVVAMAFPSGEHVAEARVRRDTTGEARMRTGCPELAAAGVATGTWVPTVEVQHLTPQKARILLMLALTRTRDVREIQRIFDTY